MMNKAGSELQTVRLPSPLLKGLVSVEEALATRRSLRAFSDRPLTLAQVSQILWAAQGITEPQRGKRTAPSAGNIHPLDTYVLPGNVPGLAPTLYHYEIAEHSLGPTGTRDIRLELGRAALDQDWLADAPLVLAFSAVYARTTDKYRGRGIRYVHMDMGIVSQNVYLQATALGLGTVYVGAFDDDRVAAVLGLSDQEHALCIMPVGYAAE